MIPKTLPGHNVPWLYMENLSITLSSIAVWPGTLDYNEGRPHLQLMVMLFLYTRH